ncbi:MAG: 2-enoyl thioester reductase domain-containing protein [Verrucomicrobia bacterium]|nr:2-enoyl thioester reductase domain-containing protein [Verrucomicrobiota bacterium]
MSEAISKHPGGREVRFSRFGPPEEVLEIGERELPEPTSGQALVRLLASPVNPADLNIVEGVYGVRPELPAVPGMEGCGEVLRCPGGELAVGSRVIFLRKGGAWAEEMVLPTEDLIAVPEAIDPVQAAMLGVNPLTALRLLEGFVDLKPGDWIVQNAANSNVGRCVIQLARERGVSTVNLVRRESLREELLGLGASVVLLDDEEMVAKALEATGGRRPVLALNAVGGDSALRQMDFLERRGSHVTYGAMSRQSLKVPNKFVIFKELTITGFWITKWLEESARAKIEESYVLLSQFVVEGKLEQAVDGSYPLEEVRAACRRAGEEGRGGKVILVPRRG